MNDAKGETSNELLNENPSGSSKENEKAHQRQVIVQEQGGDLNRLNLFDETQLAAAENFLTKVMRSEKGGIKSVNDGLAVLMRAKDLNLPFSTCLEHIHVINGKTGVDVHIIKALLLRAGCTWECLKDYQPLYEYTDSINVYVDGSLPDYCVRCISSQEAEDKRSKAGDKDDKVYVYPVKFYKDFNGNVYREYQLNSKCQLVANRSQAVEIQKSGKIPVFRIPSVPVDYVTEYHFTRWINNKCMFANSRFTFSEANAAGLFEKDTYKKYSRVLIQHRAFTYGARDIASDVLFGVMETSELKIVNSIDIDEQDAIDINN